ncbi:MAG: DUF3108 domain-containing protein [Candidatus Cloacimonadales bacterium]|nr:DUF3108 domain-containing protein [Candidatus Cloacimonadales bacterium]
MNQFIKLLILFILFGKSLYAVERIDLSIRYLGLPVVDVVMTDDGEKIQVTAKATTIASIAARMDNQYISYYSADFLTDKYRKIIRQKDYREDRITLYDRDGLVAHRISYILPEENREYSIVKESRDFYAALFYLRKMIGIQAKGEIWLDANALIWKAKYEIIGTEELNTELGHMDAIKVKFTFKQISKGEKENSDMLTNNLVNEDRSLIFWFSNDDRKIPLKAKFLMKPFPVTWKLENYIVE